MYAINLDTTTLDYIIEHDDWEDFPIEDLSEYHDLLSELEVEVSA